MREQLERFATLPSAAAPSASAQHVVTPTTPSTRKVLPSDSSHHHQPPGGTQSVGPSGDGDNGRPRSCGGLSRVGDDRAARSGEAAASTAAVSSEQTLPAIQQQTPPPSRKQSALVAVQSYTELTMEESTSTLLLKMYGSRFTRFYERSSFATAKS